MAAPKGNQYGVKIQDPETRQEAYKAYCEWIAKGKSPQSFTFEKEDLKCTARTLDSYAKLYPEEFLSIHREFAFCKGYSEWESIVEDSAKGLNKDANTASLQMVMRNKFKWDAKEPEEKVDQKTSTLTLSLAEMQEFAEWQAARKASQSATQEGQQPGQVEYDRSLSDDLTPT